MKWTNLKFSLIFIFFVYLSGCVSTGQVFSPEITSSHKGANYLIGTKAYNRGDFPLAFETFKALAEQGEVSSQNYLGFMYEKGLGVSQDKQQAVKWYTKAAEQGYSYAQYNLGIQFREGQGVPQDYQQALKWYTKAAEQDNKEAKRDLGVMYVKGQGVSKDYKKAVKLFTISAEQGDAKAQYDLGLRYVLGQGVLQDYAQAYAWIDIASSSLRITPSQGGELVKTGRDKLLEIMTPDQITEGQKLSKQLHNKIYGK
jgi:TPR repeat protein